MDAILVYTFSVLKISLINVALSGDNAVVIALAAHNLPARQRRRVVLWGGILAVAMQAVFTLLIADLLGVPGLRLAGAVLLLIIACKLMQEESAPEVGVGTEGRSRMGALILRIALANLAMSFDNVVAVASICRGDPIRMGLGLLISGLMIFIFSTAIVELMVRFKWIVSAGALVLAVTAGEMFWSDLTAASGHSTPGKTASLMGGMPGVPVHVLFVGLIVLACLAYPRWRRGLPPRSGEWARAAGDRVVAPLRRWFPRFTDQLTD